MPEKQDDNMLEETTEIQVEDHKIGPFILILYAVLIVICIAYLFLFFTPR
ncbi:MAG: hypothetical protein GF398_05915 [Chitinivibrionales bacterium]|nr:hypothetical protein [Chitinivibrionales bacterium]